MENKMKRIMALLLALLLFAPSAHAVDDDYRTDLGFFAREGTVIGRGLLCLLSVPYEPVRTTIAETEIHPGLWPFTFIPRAFLNTFVRFISAGHDVLIFPFYVPFTNDLSPWTQAYDLPDYAWQKL